jgi:hypothetical protein
MNHPHTWILAARNILASFSKRDDGQTPDNFYAAGDIDRCVVCGDYRIRPYRPDLRAVAVEFPRTAKAG